MSASQLIANRFRINDPERDLLGRGGMGVVYRATDTQTGELVAVKALDPQIVAHDPAMLERFVREGEALRRLNHPNIVRMVAAIRENGRQYLVMEYVSGGSLEDLLKKQGRLPGTRVIQIALEIADALARAHHLGIIHRDLKPANVLLAEDGTPRLADFGIAHVESGPRLTQTGLLMGTVDYLSPEVCQGEPPDERADIGRTIGKYKIVERLGQGGMATVYKAYQANLDRHVALKVINAAIADHPDSQARFEQEAKSAAALRHPNIMQIYDFDVDPESGCPYMVIELIEGGSLADDMARRAASGAALHLSETARIMAEAGAALAHAHEHGVVHRDVKPANIMRDTTGRWILSDFGLAKVMAAPGLTASGVGVGTPDYMAPEQATGEAVDGRADLYALGVILFQLLTGQLPFKADTPMAVILKRITDPVPDPRQVKPDLPASLASVLVKALAKLPDDRFQTADEFLAAFQTAWANEQKPQPVAPTAAPREAKPSASAIEWNLEEIRQLLMEAFNDDEIVTLCFDHFHPVYEEFGEGMGKDDKILKLVQYCDHYLQFGELLKHVAEHNPNQYANFAPRLRQPRTRVEPEPPVRETPPAITSTRPGTRPSYTVTLNITPPPEPSLPPAVAGFVGREKELAACADTLASRHLVVVTGMPGVGKTALAAELAKRRESPARTFWHSFHEGEGVNVLIWKLAAFLACHHQPDLWNTLQGSTQSGGQSPPSEVLLDYVFQRVRGQGYVLCLDDFHFVDDDPLLAKFVERLQPALNAGQVDVIIAAQRRPSFVLESDAQPLGGLTRDDVRLLLDQRKLALPEAALADLYTCTEGNAQLLVLAIDALRRTSDYTRVMSRLCESEQIERFLVKEVDQGLSDEERQVMSAVATLLGYPGTRDAIATALDGASVRRPLNDLVSRSLISVMEGEDGKEYSLNTLVRAYYYDLLNQRERQAMHQHLGEYYETEAPDVLRAALHFEAAKQVERAARLATADVMLLINLGRARQLADLLSRFVARQIQAELWVRVNLARGQVHTFLRNSELARASFQTALDTLGSLPAGPATQELAAQACRGMGSILEFEAPAAALDWLQCGLEKLGQANREEEAALYIQLYKIHGVMGNYDAAMEAVQKGLALLPDRASQLRMQGLKGVGNIYALRGEIETGSQYMRQALDVARQLHDDYQMAGILYNLGYDRFYLCDWPGAEGYFRQALNLTERLGDVTRQVHTRNMMGMLYINRGDDATANAFLTQALALAREGKLRLLLPYVLNSLADLQLRRGQWDAAETTLAEAEQLALEMQIKWPQVDLNAYRACVSLAKRELDTALAKAQQSVALARELNLKDILGNSLRVLGQALQASGQFAAALEAFEQSLMLLANAPYEAARTKLHWGQALKSAGEVERGTQLVREARATFAQLGAQRELKQADELLSE